MFCVMTAMVGDTIHGGWFWTTVDFFLAPLAVCKWVVYHEINLTILGETFRFFLQ